MKVTHYRQKTVLRKPGQTVIPWPVQIYRDEEFETVVLRGGVVAGRLSILGEHG
jgi:hypothetical protein